MGLLLMPLSHAAVEGAGYVSSIEGSGNILLYNNARQLRETGIQMRALLLSRRILVRGGFYEGARNTNPAGAPALNPDGMPLAARRTARQLPLVQQRYQEKQLPEDGRRAESVLAWPPRQDAGGVREHHREREPRDDAGVAPVHRAGPTRLVMRQSRLSPPS